VERFSDFEEEKDTEMNAAQLIQFLNSIGVGEVGAIQDKLERARRACLALGLEDLALRLQEASTALRDGDPKTFRKRIELAVSRLGHLK
jgi:hypothetical protein